MWNTLLHDLILWGCLKFKQNENSTQKKKESPATTTTTINKFVAYLTQFFQFTIGLCYTECICWKLCKNQNFLLMYYTIDDLYLWFIIYTVASACHGVNNEKNIWQLSKTFWKSFHFPLLTYALLLLCFLLDFCFSVFELFIIYFTFNVFHVLSFLSTPFGKAEKWAFFFFVGAGSGRGGSFNLRPLCSANFVFGCALKIIWTVNSLHPSTSCQ